MEVSTIGLDLAKNVFQAHGADASGGVVFRKQLRRKNVLEFFAKQPVCMVAMEACAGAHYWAREIGRFGHTVRLIPPTLRSSRAPASEVIAPPSKPATTLWPSKPFKFELRGDTVWLHRTTSTNLLTLCGKSSFSDSWARCTSYFEKFRLELRHWLRAVPAQLSIREFRGWTSLPERVVNKTLPMNPA